MSSPDGPNKFNSKTHATDFAENRHLSIFGIFRIFSIQKMIHPAYFCSLNHHFRYLQISPISGSPMTARKAKWRSAKFLQISFGLTFIIFFSLNFRFHISIDIVNIRLLNIHGYLPFFLQNIPAPNFLYSTSLTRHYGQNPAPVYRQKYPLFNSRCAY